MVIELSNSVKPVKPKNESTWDMVVLKRNYLWHGYFPNWQGTGLTHQVESIGVEVNYGVGVRSVFFYSRCLPPYGNLKEH